MLGSFLIRSYTFCTCSWFSSEPQRCCISHKEIESAAHNTLYILLRKTPRYGGVSWVMQKCPSFGPTPAGDQGSIFLTSQDEAPCTSSTHQQLSVFLGVGIFSSNRAWLKQAEALCSALILHFIIPLFTVSRCEEAFHFLEHCYLQTG